MTADKQITEEAAQWLMRLEEDGSAQCRTEFFEWLQQSSRHVREFLCASETWQGLDGLGDAGGIDVRRLIDESRRNVVQLETGPDPQTDRHDEVRAARRPRRRLAVAAVATLAGITVSWSAWQYFAPRVYETGTGEQRSFQLSDGSVLHLNAGTRIEVEYSRRLRHLSLTQGEALFVVGRDSARPFRVAAGAAVIEALGTQFNVYRRGGGAMVSVLEGAVQVTSGRQPVQLQAGEEANVVGSDRALKRAAPDVPRAVAWRRRQLVFRDDPLAQVAAEFNRYNRLQIRVEGEAARNKHLIGMFDADDPRSLLLFLQKDPDLRIESGAEEIVIRSSRRE